MFDPLSIATSVCALSKNCIEHTNRILFIWRILSAMVSMVSDECNFFLLSIWVLPFWNYFAIYIAQTQQVGIFYQIDHDGSNYVLWRPGSYCRFAHFTTHKILSHSKEIWTFCAPLFLAIWGYFEIWSCTVSFIKCRQSYPAKTQLIYQITNTNYMNLKAHF